MSMVACPSCGRKNRVPGDASGIPRCAICHTPLPWAVDADDGSFDRVVSTSRVPVLVDLWAPWCGPCRVVSPLLEQLVAEKAGTIKLVKVNVDEAPGVQARFLVQGVPTFVLLVGGDEVGRLVGAHPLPELRRWVEATVAAAP